MNDLKSTPNDWAPVTIDDYNQFSKLANVEHPYVPSDVTEVVPMHESRGADSILMELKEYEDPLIKGILHLHEVAVGQHQTDLVASRETMRTLAKNFDSVFQSYEQTHNDIFSDLADSLDTNNPNNLQESVTNVDDSPGVVISDDIHHALVVYQSLQERLESKDQIERVNTFFENRPDVIEAILGIQRDLCLKIDEFIKANPDMEDSTVAFSEIAFIDENDKSVSPNPRFLKIITHNWGSYFVDKPEGTVEQLLSMAITRALEDQIYRQYIFVFRSDEEKLKLHGITPKVCPARVSIGHMIKHYIKE